MHNSLAVPFPHRATRSQPSLSANSNLKKVVVHPSLQPGMQVLQRSLQPMLNTTNSNFMRLESQINTASPMRY
jgi:hypothetical protein